MSIESINIWPVKEQYFLYRVEYWELSQYNIQTNNFCIPSDWLINVGGLIGWGGGRADWLASL
jgi:hypothetical protein